MMDRSVYEIDPGYLEKYKDASWLETVTGRQFHPANPRPEDITIFDIAHSLGMKCRYNGHTRKFYSVAEHSTTLALVARHQGLPVSLQFEFLMHDAAEFVLPDVCRPIKHYFPELIVMEKVLGGMIRHWAGLTGPVPETVKAYDSRIIKDERRDVMFPSSNLWQTEQLEALNVRLHGHAPIEAEYRFLQAFQMIGGEHHGQPVMLAYEPGEFYQRYDNRDQEIYRDEKTWDAPDIRLIDLLGNCALAWTKEEQPRPFYINGDFSHVLGPELLNR